MNWAAWTLVGVTLGAVWASLLWLMWWSDHR